MKPDENQEKRALVTGAGRGIGLAIAEALAREGASVMLADLDEKSVTAAASTLGGNARATVADVSRPEDVEAAVNATVDAFGGLDILVNNAGIEVSKPLVEHTEGEFRRLMSVNVDGVFYGIKFATPALADGGGTIVNVASLAALGGAPMLGGYCASKAAVLQLTRVAALELRDAGIRVNCVCPAFIETQMVEDLRAPVESVAGMPFDDFTALKQGRLGKAEEVAEAVRFLASDEAPWTTGSHYILDNGVSGGLF